MKLLCIDSNSIVNRAFYGIKLLSNKEGIYTNAIYGFFTILQKLREEYAPDCIVAAFDLRAPTFRHLQYDAYKAGRKGMPEELASQIPLVKELLTHLGIPVIAWEGYEADDILGSLAASCEVAGWECLIATGDRDSLQLVSPTVSVLLATTKMGKPVTTVCTPDYIRETYGVTPIQLIEVKSLMGDSSDNIPGVPGIGEKGALKLICEYQTLDGVYKALDAGDIPGKLADKLAVGRESAYLSRELATIHRSVPGLLPLEEYYQQPADFSAARSLLSKLQMFSLITRLKLPEGTAPLDTTLASTPSAPTVTVEEGSIPALLALLEEGTPVSAVAEFTEDLPTALAVARGDRVLLFSTDAVAAAKVLFANTCPVYTFGIKSFWRFLLSQGLRTENIAFDLELAAYLLSPNSTEYTLPLLAGEYSVVEPEGVEGLALSGALLSALCPVLKEKIESAQLSSVLYDIELPLAEVLAAVELVGFLVDSDGIRQFGDALRLDIARLESEIHTLCGETFNISSPKQLGEILFGKLALPSRKKTKSGYSTDAEVLESLSDYHPVIEKILEYRQLTKLLGTYVDGLLKVVSADNRIHTVFRQTETRTGRISSIEPNLQNIPVRTKRGASLRRCFIAPAGRVLVDADYSQIELRVLAHIANDKVMLNAFLSGEDIHTTTAAQVFDLPPLMVTPQMRSSAKAVNFGIVYGIGAFSLAKDIGVSVKEADQYIKNYLQKYSGVAAYMEQSIKQGEDSGFVSTMFGRRRYLPELRSTNKNLQAFGRRVAMNMPIQGSAADIIKVAMIRVYRRLLSENLTARLVLQVHDELIVETPKEEEARVSMILQQEMEGAVALHSKLSVDLNVGENWYDAK